MPSVLLVQLPVPQLNFGHQTGNIPFAAACLVQAAGPVKADAIEILPQTISTYAGDAALLDIILSRRPDFIGFTAYMWNIQRTLALCANIKEHYAPTVILGGPEITPDSPWLMDETIDFFVQGEGEEFFTRLLHEPHLMFHPNENCESAHRFPLESSPYLGTALDPGLENIMLLETMRGCPHGCAFCFYNKSRKGMTFKEDSRVLEGMAWAREKEIREIYLLDPSLNSRPGLKDLLKKIAVINKDHKLALISEMRAEAIDEELADLLSAAGFTRLEVGLQSTNPAALKLMRRKTDLHAFAKGARRLMEKKITPVVDLIVGLPGDDLGGFERTIRFVADQQLHRDIQVFPLSILPGTEFRRRRKALGLIFEETPPYTVISTPTFSEQDIPAAFNMAEDCFHRALYAMPDLDPAYRTGALPSDIKVAKDIWIRAGEAKLTYKVFLHRDRTDADLAKTARKVTHPYQLMVPPGADPEQINKTVTLFTACNPYTPLELVFFEPGRLPDTAGLLSAARLARPHYLDNDLRLLYPEPGNRAIWFTLVSEKVNAAFSGPAKRHVFWWKKSHLPEEFQMENLEENGFDGILIDTPASPEQIANWQDEIAHRAEDLMPIAFSETGLHKRWLQKTRPEHYCFSVLPE